MGILLESFSERYISPFYPRVWYLKAKVKYYSLGMTFLLFLIFYQINICGAKGPGYLGPFRMVSPRAQSRRKTSKDD